MPTDPKSFTPMDPNHELLVAGRYNDAGSEEKGLEATCLDIGLDVNEVAYVAEQRAMRVVMLMSGRQEELAAAQRDTNYKRITFNAHDRTLIDRLAALYMDGIALGWRANDLKRNADAPA